MFMWMSSLLAGGFYTRRGAQHSFRPRMGGSRWTSAAPDGLVTWDRLLELLQISVCSFVRVNVFF